MSKAAQIRKLHGTMPDSKIAELVGCRVEYVRVAALQRIGGANSAADLKYYRKRYVPKPKIVKAKAGPKPKPERKPSRPMRDPGRVYHRILGWV